MSTHRVPLADNPNAANSPYRATLASKRARADAIGLENDGSPPKKKQMFSKNVGTSRRAQKISVNEPEGRVFAERRDNAPQSYFQRKLLAAQGPRHTFNNKTDDKPEVQTTGPNKEQIRSWRRHYRRVFPDFVIYLDSLPSETALQLKRAILKLGGRQEQFFSKDVTHIITTRPIPSGASEGTSKDAKTTIDPSVLNKTTDRQVSRGPQRGNNAFQDQLSRTTNETRQTSNSNDVLYKAHNLGIKIWALEKFERMMMVMFSPDTTEEEDVPVLGGGSTVTKSVPLKRSRDNDLSQMLRNERNNAPVERKPWQEIIPFKGVYIYIHDMDEKVKPVMLREYPNPTGKEAGEWPMLRSVSKGRCPFVEELPPEKRPAQRRANENNEKAAPDPPRLTRAQTAPNPPETQQIARRTRSTTRSPQKPVLGDVSQNLIVKPAKPAPPQKGFEPPPVQRHNSGSTENMPPLLGSAHANFRGIPRNHGGEPVASGMQKDVTSAIRSQMFSSTAPAAPGARVGMSKQQHQMSRRVLERQSGLSGNSIPSSFNVNDVRAAINNEQTQAPRPAPAPRRSTRQKPGGPLGLIHEDAEAEADTKAPRQKPPSAKKKTAATREPKPGYCENCRDKYEDFQEHVVSKKHRKFATDDENWKELDELLKKLMRT